jgi:hypothetical protein
MMRFRSLSPSSSVLIFSTTFVKEIAYQKQLRVRSKTTKARI